MYHIDRVSLYISTLIGIFLVTSFVFCNGNKQDNKDRFEIYLINDVDIDTVSNLELLLLPDEPLISDNDIISYEWNIHKINLKKIPMENIKKIITRELVGLGGTPFLVTINRKPIYYGKFWSLYNSLRPTSPVVYIESIHEDNSFMINGGIVYDEIVSNVKVLNAMKNQDKIVISSPNPDPFSLDGP